MHSHATSDNLTHAGHQDIDTFSDAAVRFVSLHVEGLDLSGEVSEENGLVDDVGHLAFCGLSNIITKLVGLALLVGNVVLTQPVDGFGVLHASEGAAWGFEVRVELVDEGRDGGVTQRQINDAADHGFEVVEQVGEGDEVELRLDVSVLG